MRPENAFVKEVGESLRRRIGASHDVSEALEISEQIVDGQVRFKYKNDASGPQF